MTSNPIRKQVLLLSFLLLTALAGNLLIMPSITHAAGYMGHRKKKGCTKCHKEQYKSWKKMRHAKAMKTLLPGEFTEEKLKAELDPDKNYLKPESVT